MKDPLRIAGFPRRALDMIFAGAKLYTGGGAGYMNAKELIFSIPLMLTFAQGGSAQSSGFEASLAQDISSMQVDIPAAVPEISRTGPEGASAGAGAYVFQAESFPGFYNAASQNKDPYNIPEIVRDIPAMWRDYGVLFRKVGAAMEMDPYALASYCVFESYNEKKHTFNIRHLDGAAAGIASTQVNDVKGGLVPGLNVRLPRDPSRARQVLRDNPEYGLRYLAAEFKAWYLGGDYFRGYYGGELYRKIFGDSDFRGYRDLAKTFPRVALPGWRKPGESKGNYGTQPQYVSRAYVLYKAFSSADSN